MSSQVIYFRQRSSVFNQATKLLNFRMLGIYNFDIGPVRNYPKYFDMQFIKTLNRLVRC